MADTAMHKSWRIFLSNEEFTLVLKALGGRLTGNGLDYTEAARALGDKLTDQKATQMQACIDEGATLQENVAKARAKS